MPYSFILCAELTPHLAAQLFYNGEVEAELRRVGLLEYRFKLDSDREECMHMLESKRRESVYPHNGCTDDCKKRGKNRLLRALVLTPLYIRLWTSMGDRWYMEDSIPTLHV